MNTRGSSTIPVSFLLISSVLIGASVYNFTSTEINEENPDENNLIHYANQIINETVDEITTYLQTVSTMGKFNGSPPNQKINQIVILVKPMLSKNIDISELIIELFNGNHVKYLNYSGDTLFIESYGIFEHPLWNSLSENNFGLIVVYDEDTSIANYGIFNEKTDMVFLTIKLPEIMEMSKGDKLTITLIHAIGIKRSIDLKAPLPIKSIINFDE